MTKAKSIAVAALLAALAACQSSGQPVSSGAATLSAEAIVERVSGNTEIWTKGGGYYSEDGSLLAKWNGKTHEGTWEMKGDSLCLNVTA